MECQKVSITQEFSSASREGISVFLVVHRILVSSYMQTWSCCYLHFGEVQCKTTGIHTKLTGLRDTQITCKAHFSHFWVCPCVFSGGDCYTGQQTEWKRPAFLVDSTTLRQGPWIEQEIRRNSLVLPPKAERFPSAIPFGHQSLGFSAIRLWDLHLWALLGSWVSSIPVLRFGLLKLKFYLTYVGVQCESGYCEIF